MDFGKYVSHKALQDFDGRCQESTGHAALSAVSSVRRAQSSPRVGVLIYTLIYTHAG